MEKKFDIDSPQIYLRNGSILPCYPLAKTDTSHVEKPDPNLEKIFGENVFLFLTNADLIFNDSRMFLADSGVRNGMAYSGGFKNGCLGAYLEWWIYNHRFSIDGEGRPIWFLSGSPLTGCHACLTADKDGKHYPAKLQAGFMAVCKSYVGVCKDYYAAMANCQAFTIQEVIDILKGKESPAPAKARIHTLVEYFKMDNQIQSLQHKIEYWRRCYQSVTQRLEQLLFENHYDELVEYHNQWRNLLTIANLKEEHFKQQRIELRKQLRSQQITNKEYQQALMPLKKGKEDAERVWRQFSDERLGVILGEDSGRLHPRTIDNLFKQRLSQ